MLLIVTVSPAHPTTTTPDSRGGPNNHVRRCEILRAWEGGRASCGASYEKGQVSCPQEGDAQENCRKHDDWPRGYESLVSGHYRVYDFAGDRDQEDVFSVCHELCQDKTRWRSTCTAPSSKRSRISESITASTRSSHNLHSSCQGVR